MTLPDGKTRLYRFNGLWSAEDFVDEHPETRSMLMVAEATRKYPVYDRRRWITDEHGLTWCLPKHGR